MTKNIGWRIALTTTAVAAFASMAGTLSAASGPERSLAGIPIFAPGSQVTRKFGNPSRILVGGVSAATAGGGASASGGGYPGGGGGGYPGGGGGGYPGGGGGTDASGAALPGRQTVTLIYDRPLGGDLEFTISPDKRVVQIRETGYSGAYGTARGIKLGTKYSQVIARYGYQENTTIAGSIINIDYKDTLHCGFQFLDQKLVGIIVAAPD